MPFPPLPPSRSIATCGNLRLHARQDRHEAQLQAGLQQRGLVALVDVRRLVQVVGQAHAPGCSRSIRCSNRYMLVSALMVMVVPLEAAPSMSVCMIGWPLTLVISKASSNRSFRPNWLWLAATRRARPWPPVLRVLLGALGQVEHREVLAFLVLAGAVDDLVDVLERILFGARTMRKLCRLETWRLLISRLNRANWCSRLS